MYFIARCDRRLLKEHCSKLTVFESVSMDIYYNPNDLLRLQLTTVAVAIGILVVLGLIFKKRQTWLLVTLLSWFVLFVFYVTHAPSGVPYPS